MSKELANEPKQTVKRPEPSVKGKQCGKMSNSNFGSCGRY
jgi:hypothetical protein